MNQQRQRKQKRARYGARYFVTKLISLKQYDLRVENNEMIVRRLLECETCEHQITARIQIGYDENQLISFLCPNCNTEIKLTLNLDDPPNVKMELGENCKIGKEEGTIMNIGAGFTISSEKLHSDFYFPSFDLPRPNLINMPTKNKNGGFTMIDMGLALGVFPNVSEAWKKIDKTIRFNRIGNKKLEKDEINSFWSLYGKYFFGTNFEDVTEESVEGTLFAFLMRFMEPKSNDWLNSLIDVVKKAYSQNTVEYERFIDHYNLDLKKERVKDYANIFSDYFKSYGEFNQTLIYSRQDLEIPRNTVATSRDFHKTKMFYGNAFEVLGSNLDVVVAINNINSGRDYDKMELTDLKKFRSINKANRTNFFKDNIELSWLVKEYDSTIRNASHHRWFKINDAHTEISFRSGGTGALNKISYAEYLEKCNKICFQLMILACLELAMFYEES